MSRVAKVVTETVTHPAVVSAPAKKAAKVAATPAKLPKVGDYTKDLILKGLDNESVIAVLQVKFPERANSLSNVLWYRRALKKDGAEV